MARITVTGRNRNQVFGMLQGILFCDLEGVEVIEQGDYKFVLEDPIAGTDESYTIDNAGVYRDGD